MIHYLFMIAAVACFVAQFSFTKLYEESVGQTLGATLIMIAGTSLAGALIFFLIGGCLFRSFTECCFCMRRSA